MSGMSLGLSAVPPAESVTVERQRQFFDVSPLKLIVMATVTFGLYEIYWFYQQWQTRKERGDDVMPLPRAIFGVLFAHALFKEIDETGRAAGAAVSIRPGAYAFLFFALQFSWRLPDPFWLLGFITVLPLVAAQQDIARIHRALGLDPTVNDRFTWKNILGIVFGCLWLLLVIVGMSMPAQ